MRVAHALSGLGFGKAPLNDLPFSVGCLVPSVHVKIVAAYFMQPNALLFAR